MKMLYWFSLSALLCVFACASSEADKKAEAATNNVPVETTGAPSPSGNAAVIDSAKINAVLQYCQEIDRKIKPDNVIPLKPNLYDPKDVIGIVSAQGKILRATASVFPPNMEQRIYYYLRNEKLILVKHRQWNKFATPPSAREVHAYMDEAGKIFQIFERSVQLNPGENPGSLGGQTLEESRMNKDSLNTAITAEWEKVHTAIQKQK